MDPTEVASGLYICFLNHMLGLDPNYISHLFSYLEAKEGCKQVWLLVNLPGLKPNPISLRTWHWTQPDPNPPYNLSIS